MNHLSGTIPTQIGNLESLQQLYVLARCAAPTPLGSLDLALSHYGSEHPLRLVTSSRCLVTAHATPFEVNARHFVTAVIVTGPDAVFLRGSKTLLLTSLSNSSSLL